MVENKNTESKNEEIKNGICYMCMEKCPIKIHVKDGKATSIDIVNEAVSYCPRWKAQLDFVYHPDRLKYPIKRVGERGSDQFERISWDEALDLTASNLQKIKEDYGPESVAFWISYTKEPRPYFHRLVHAFGSPNYCTESSSCFSATWTADNLTYGAYSEPGTMQQPSSLYGYSKGVEPSTKLKLVWSSSYKNSSPTFWESQLKAKDRGIKLIVVDPLLTKLADMADIHLQLRPGTDGALALGMMNVIINEDLHDKEFTENWTVGFDDLKNYVQEYTPERVEKITWVPAAKIKEAAKLYATNKPAKIGISPQATTHHTNGVQNHRAIILLAAITGNIGIEGGNKATVNHQPLNDITLHEKVEEMPPGVGSERFPIWTSRYDQMQSNAIVGQIESGKPYPIKGIFSAGLNLQYFPNTKRFADNLKKLDFIGVTEYFESPATRLSDVVLPIASWLEREILVWKHGPPIIKLIEPAIEPVGETRTEWEIYSELAERLGFGDKLWNGDFKKCVNYMLRPLDITYEDLKENPEGIEHQLKIRPDKFYEESGFPTPSGKVEISSSTLAEHGHDPLPTYKEPLESPLSRPDLADSFPLVLTTGARVVAYTHSQFRNIDQLRELMKEPLASIHPTDAQARGIESGDKVTISSPRGEIEMTANVTAEILPGVVSVPHQWEGKANANLLIDDHNLDPISGFPPFKSQLCQVSKK